MKTSADNNHPSNMSDADMSRLVDAAKAAYENAYAPYTEFPVGAAFRTRDGRIFSGACLEAVTHRGLDATESAIGRMVSRNGWEYNEGTLEITDIVYYVPNIDKKNNRHLPSPEARGFLSVFAGGGDIMTHYATADQGVVLSRPLSSLITDVPKIGKLPRSLQERFEKFGNQPPLEKEKKHIAPEDAEKLLMARFNALNPKSDFAVGVLIKTEDGHEFTGCNIEFGPNLAMHAEQVACADMVTTLGPDAKIKEMVVQVDGDTPWIACPVCINTISEFRSDATTITAASANGAAFTKKYTNIFTEGGFEGYRVRQVRHPAPPQNGK
jgi:cytidine deaminase